MKKFKDVKVGDTVFVYNSGDYRPVEKYTVTYIEEVDSDDQYLFHRIGYGSFGSKP